MSEFKEFDVNWHDFKSEGLPKENGRFLVKYRIAPNNYLYHEVFDFAVNLKDTGLEDFESDEFNHAGFYDLNTETFERYEYTFNRGDLETLIAWAKVSED